MTEVVAALIKDGDRFLICQRPKHKSRGGLWEFVGGKVEHGETHEEALFRECHEELGVSICVGRKLANVSHLYSDIAIKLSLYECSILSGNPQLLEHTAMAWITMNETEKYSFCPADVELLQLINK